MRHLSISSLLILALVGLSLCGALMACMDSIGHYGTLASGIAGPVIALIAVILALAAVHIGNTPASWHPASTVRQSRDGPETLTWHPLHEALATGIIQPKLCA